MIYLDHNATTPLDPAVLERMLPWLRGAPGNASSVHQEGQRARHAVDEAREQVAGALGCAQKQLVFTSGGTEADNLALRGVLAAQPPSRRRLVISAVEHPAVLETARALAAQGADLVLVPVDANGALDLEALDRAVTPDTALVSTLWANNETGALFPIETIARLCRERAVPLHVDAVQAFGKIPIDLSSIPIDLLSVSAHKIHGPQGAGALYVRPGTPLAATQTGGLQERGRRAGTENVAALVGFGEAARLASERLNSDTPRTARLADRLRRAIAEQIDDVLFVASDSPRVGSTLCVCFRQVEAEALLMALDLAGIRASSGSACASGSLEPSHVLAAMGVPGDYLRGAIRFSVGRTNTEAEIDEVGERLPAMVAALRRAARRG